MPYTQSGQAQVWWESQGQGPALVLINGLSSPSAVWFRLTPLLSPHHQVITFDNLGTGRTDTPAAAITVADMTDAAVAVIRAAGASSAHVLGMSMGGMIAQQLALEHPGLVSSLSLVATSAGAPHLTGNEQAVTALAEATHLDPGERNRVLAALIYAQGTPQERIDEDLRVRAEHPTTEEGYRKQHEALADWERLDDLSAIDCPALVLHGAQDRMVPVKHARQLAEHIPNAELVVLEGAGHQLFTDEPEVGSAAVLEFLAVAEEAN